MLAAMTVRAQSAFPLPADSVVIRSVRIDTGKAQLTGICMMRAEGDSVLGSMVNEFGIKAFDFIADRTKGKVRLFNIVSFLDKWYIRRTVAADLAYLLTARIGDESKKYSLSVDAGATTLKNLKRHITYEFSPLRNDCDDSNNTSNEIRE